MNYYERHIGDYLKDTSHLSLLEHGVYSRLMDVYYTREAGLPQAEVARLIGARSKDERAALAAVLAEFFVLVDGMYQQDRCEREIARFRSKSEKAKASINKRWEKARAVDDSLNERNTNVSTDGYERITDDIHRAPVPSNQTPDTRHQKNQRESGAMLKVEGARPAPPLTPVLSRFQVPLPDDWSPSDETVSRVTRARPDLAGKVRMIAEDFRDYIATQAGVRALSADWETSFFRWAAKERKDRSAGGQTRLPGGFVA